MGNKIKVVIVDDSAVVRQVVSQALAKDRDIEILATASDPLFATERMRLAWPDVIILDIEMPRMDGISFLKKIMAERPTPVIICSSLAERGSQASFEALANGAVAIITKPKVGLKDFLEDSSNDIVQAVHSAARANVRALLRNAEQAAATPTRPTARDPVSSELGHAALKRTTDQVIAIGTSTGGTQALEFILTRLPVTTLGLIIVQHMPAMFTGMFAARLNGLSQMEVREAQNGDRVMPGRALIAPGGRHMELKRSGAQYIVDVYDGPVVNRHKPSVDVLFRSVAKSAGANALGIIMTGMGDDGARGIKEMRDAGARTVAQDEASCVVFGMPREAIRMGGAETVMPLDQIPRAIMDYNQR